MSRFTLALVALAAVVTSSSFAQAGGCGGYKKSYGYGHNTYRQNYNYGHDYGYDRHYVKPVVREVIVEKPVIHEVIVEKPVVQEVIIEKPVCTTPACALPSLGFFGVICPEGMLVKEVQPNSEACRLGLAPGDVIKMVDDIRIICEDDWLHALKCAGPTACLKVIPCGCHEIVIMHAQLGHGLAY